MIIGGPQIPEMPPKKPATSATAALDPTLVPARNRSRQPASWLIPKPVIETPRRAKSSRSGSATTSCADSAIATTSTRFSQRNSTQAAPGRAETVAQRLEQVRHQHRHDQERHRHLERQERPHRAQRRSAAARSRPRPWQTRPPPSPPPRRAPRPRRTAPTKPSIPPCPAPVPAASSQAPRAATLMNLAARTPRVGSNVAHGLTPPPRCALGSSAAATPIPRRTMIRREARR